MTCPGCAAAVEVPRGTVGVCACCARSLVQDADGVRFATAADLAGLRPDQIKELRLARPASWRNDVRARKAQIASR